MRPLKNLCEVAVIGGGLAGLSAACHAARRGRLVTLFEGSGLYGGQVATTDEVDGVPAPGKFSGVDLAIHLLEEARKIGVQVVEAEVTGLELGARLALTDNEGRRHHPEAIILASGASLRRLGVPGEAELNGRGVSRCATCDGMFFRNMDVAVIGGGDAAVHEALVLAKTSRRVFMICRSPVKAKRIYVDRLDARENVSFIWDNEVAVILGDEHVTGLRLRNVKHGGTSELECAGVFPFIGVIPNTQFLPASLRTAEGLVETDLDYVSAEPRLFAAGAVRAGYGGNIVQAMAEGVGAAEAAVRRLAG